MMGKTVEVHSTSGFGTVLGGFIAFWGVSGGGWVMGNTAHSTSGCLGFDVLEGGIAVVGGTFLGGFEGV
jgi:hypothetical protein